ncbi:hypothetical protein GTA08_BOTSDO01349 [Botryosphaeria dothidea]|uniref:Uncharacterized protein n=1 Tax=Botryosphaeria dothidea TaxID=55169 RepID=A0A8H4J6F1_9PEZI|nr:hypothetical protein GTA08_BOTSDO01349 [Botryosphaeria dothidea]
MFDKHDPYYIEYDVFESIEKTEKAVQTLIDLDYPGILTHGKNTTYLGADGLLHDLRPTIAYQGEVHFPVYFIRAFHQMHCIIIFTDEYGHRVHGQKTKWDPEHMAHCINILREAVSCLADASVASFTYHGDNHIAHDQQSRCRNYMALRNWADDPERAARYENVIHD